MRLEEQGGLEEEIEEEQEHGITAERRLLRIICDEQELPGALPRV